MSDRKTDQWEERRAGGKGVCALSDERAPEFRSSSNGKRPTAIAGHKKGTRLELRPRAKVGWARRT